MPEATGVLAYTVPLPEGQCQGSGPALLLFTRISQTSQVFLLFPSLVPLSKL